MRRSRKYGLVLAAIGAAVAGVVWYLERPRTVTVAIGGPVTLDDTPFGDVAFNTDRLTAEFRATLAPGEYAVDSPEGRFIVVVPDSASVAGNLSVVITDRGEDAGRRWVAVGAEGSRLTFTPSLRVIDPQGVSATLDQVSVEEGGAKVAVQPMVGRSMVNWVANRIWSAPGTEAGTATPVRDVTVATGLLTLREGGRLGWHGAPGEAPSHLGIGPASQVAIRDLAVTGSSDITGGNLAVKLAVGRDSEVRQGGIVVRSDGGKAEADLTVRRTAAGGTTVALAPGTTGSLHLDRVRVTPAPDAPELMADHFDAILDQATWEQRPGAEIAVACRSRVEVKSLTLPAGLAGVRVESVTATATGGADGVRLDSVRVRVPKAAVIAEAKARLPKTFAVPDQPIAGNIAELFRDVKLTGVTVDAGSPAVAFEKGQVAFSSRPVVRGSVAALGRQDRLMWREEEVDGPLGFKGRIKVPYHEVSWVPRVSLPFTVPLTVGGRANVEVVPGATLGDAKLKVKIACESVTVGEPTVEGLPELLKPAVQLAARFRDQVRIDGKTLADHVKGLATREDAVPLFALDPKLTPALRRVTLSEPTLGESGDDLILTAKVSFRNP